MNNLQLKMQQGRIELPSPKNYHIAILLLLTFCMSYGVVRGQKSLLMIDELDSFAALSSIEKSNSVTLFPNPVSGDETLTVVVKDLANVKKIKIFDKKRKLIFNKNLKKNYFFNINNSCPGTYHLMIYTKNKKYHRRYKVVP